MKTKLNKTIRRLKYLPVIIALSACGNTLDRLENVGRPPVVTQPQNPVQHASYQPLTSWPTPLEPEARNRSPNSLWESGSRSFFKDQRATRVGDILTVIINIADEAELSNTTTRGRTTSEDLSATTLFGLEEKLLKVLPGNPNLNDLFNIDGNSTSNGNGTITREEEITTKMAAVVTQVLPNGNMVIRGTQQVRVNYEKRDMVIEGIIRPEDISSDNTINSEQIAEARVIYGGEGLISDVQQPRVGNQVIDILSPF